MRGRKPKPTHLKLLQGNPGCRPIKEEPQPARSTNVPEAPDILTAEAREEWDRIVEEVYNLGLLTVVDTQSLAAYCQAYGRWVVAERALAKLAKLDPQTGGLMIKSKKNNAPIPNPLIYIASAAARDMVKYASEFGFTPASRTRIAAGHQAQTSKFGGLLG
jgi:P27 family predicted phage terminase small subunit